MKRSAIAVASGNTVEEPAISIVPESWPLPDPEFEPPLPDSLAPAPPPPPLPPPLGLLSVHPAIAAVPTAPDARRNRRRDTFADRAGSSVITPSNREELIAFSKFIYFVDK
jgi:hypothetical protein